MEITVRTAEEIAADRVTIEVNGARLYTAAEVGDAQASEAELVAEPKLFIILHWPYGQDMPEPFGIYTEDRLDEAWRQIRDLEEDEFEAEYPSNYHLKELTDTHRPEWVRYSWLTNN
jgi:hypothetical protein